MEILRDLWPLFLFLLYFMPSFIASWRKHSKDTAIIVLNLLAGWTFLGWIVAVVWAFTENNRIKKEEK